MCFQTINQRSLQNDFFAQVAYTLNLWFNKALQILLSLYQI